MSKKKMVVKLIDAAIYAKDELIGVATVQLNKFTSQTESFKGFGVGGTIELPTPGLYESQELVINWSATSEDSIKLSKPKFTDLQIRNAIQSIGLGEDADPESLVLYVRGIPKELDLGKVEPGATMDTSLTLEVTYSKIEYNDKTLIELDKLNRKNIIDGEDILAKVNKILRG